MSFCSFPQQCWYLDGKLIERAGRGMQLGFENRQVLGRNLEIAMAEQERNAAWTDASVERGRSQTGGVAR
jgi:hypothetical protein